MKRHVEDKMAAWKSREGRKPLVLMGARQVGKTWLMHEFCKKNFRHVHEFNFDEQRGIAQLFAETKTPKELLPKLSALSGSKIDVRNDVLIFDEIQELRRAQFSEVLLREMPRDGDCGRGKSAWSEDWQREEKPHGGGWCEAEVLPRGQG